MENLKLKVYGMSITLIDMPKLITLNWSLKAEFEFSKDWVGVKTAIFEVNGKAYAVVLDEDNSCLIPEECYKSKNLVFTVGCISENLTTNKVNVKFAESCYVQNTTISNPTEDVYTQLLDKINDIKQDDELKLEVEKNSENVAKNTEDIEGIKVRLDGLQESNNDLAQQVTSVREEISLINNDLALKYITVLQLQNIISNYYTKNEVDTLISKVNAVVRVKGRVDNVDLLPIEGNNVGDIYFVGLLSDENTVMRVWDGTHWKIIGTEITTTESLDLLPVNTFVISTDMNLASVDDRFVLADGAIVDENVYSDEVILYDLNGETLPPIITATDRKGYIATCPFGNNMYDCFDGSSSSYGFVSQYATWEQAFMLLESPQIEYIESVYFTPTVTSTHAPIQTEIDVSIDGINFTTIGTVTTKLVTGVKNTVTLEEPILTKYIRLRFVTNGLAESKVGANIGVSEMRFTTYADSTKKRLPYRVRNTDGYYYYKVK